MELLAIIPKWGDRQVCLITCWVAKTMRNSHCFSILPVLLLLVATTACRTPKPTTHPFTDALSSSGSDVEGKSYMSKISGESLLATPRWSAKRDQPPLAPGAAKRAAMKMLSQTVADVRQWKLEEISLKQPFDGALGEEYWIYQIRFSGPKYKSQFGSNMGSTLNVSVLMSGEAVPVEPVNAK